MRKIRWKQPSSLATKNSNKWGLQYIVNISLAAM